MAQTSETVSFNNARHNFAPPRTTKQPPAHRQQDNNDGGPDTSNLAYPHPISDSEGTRVNNMLGFSSQNVTATDTFRIRRKPLPSYKVEFQNEQHLEEKAISSQTTDITLFSTWWVEMIACLLVVSALVAMVITVLKFEGRPLPQWPHHLSINSIIAIYSVILRAAAGLILSQGLGQLKWKHFQKHQCLQDVSLYDDSTRGPWGSLRLLYNLRGRHIIAYIGAFSTVAALLIDPFTQQVINPYSCTWPDYNSLAYLPRTSVYYGHGVHSGAGLEYIDPGTRAAIFAGLFTETAPQVKYNCTSGNCTYETFNTIGFCPTCFEVTSNLIIKTNSTNVPEQYNNGSFSGSYQRVNITTFWIHGQAEPIASVNSSSPSLMIGRWSWYYGANKTVFLVVARQTDYLSFDYKNITGLIIDENAKAFQCEMGPCVRTVNASIEKGILYEHTLATSQAWNFHDAVTTLSMVDLACMNEGQRDLWSKCGYLNVSDPTNTFVPSDITKLSNGTLRSTSGRCGTDILDATPTQCIYSTTGDSEYAVSSLVATMFEGNLVPAENDYYYAPEGPSELIYLWSQGPDLQGLSTSMTRIADSLTSHVRQTESQDHNLSSPATGVNHIATTCVSVRWPWLAYVAVVGLTIIAFFVLTVIQTSIGPEKCQSDFKSSALALICTGLADEVRAQVTTEVLSGRQSELEKASKHVKVRFVSSMGRFVEKEPNRALL